MLKNKVRNQTLNKTLKKTAFLLVMLLWLLPLNGCWNRIEPEEYAWLTCVGLDLLDNGSVKVNVLTMPPLSPVPTGIAEPEKLMHKFTATGKTVFEAVRNVNQYLPKRLFWSYLRAVVIGEDMARSGVAQHLDVFFRNVRIRKNAWVFLTHGPIDTVFEVNPQIEKNPATLLDFLVKTESTFSGKSRVVTVKDFQRELAEPGVDPVVSVLGVWDVERQRLLPQGEPVPPNSEFALNGSAVFRDNKLIDWLSADDSQTLLLAKGEVKSSLIVIPDPDVPENRVGIEVIANKGGLKAQLEGEQVKGTLKIKITGNIGDQWLKQPNVPAKITTEDPKFYRQLNDALAQKIKSDVENLFAKAQAEWQADIFGLGDYIHNRYPNDWEHIQANWREYYEKAAIDVEVKVNILAPNVLRSRLTESGTENSWTE